MRRIIPMLTGCAGLLVLAISCDRPILEAPERAAEEAEEAMRPSEQPEGKTGKADVEPTSARMAQLRRECPMAAEGASVRVTDTDQGVALVFGTTGDADELRDRVRVLGAQYRQDRSERDMMWTRVDDDQGRAAAGPEEMPAVIAVVQREGDEVRLTLEPEDDEQLDAVRRIARAHAQRLQNQECPMLHPAA